MNLSFLATILFAAMAIAGAFLANLVVLVFTNSHWHGYGVILAIAAAGASYWAQHNFTNAGYHRDDLARTGQLQAVAAQAANEIMQRSEQMGVVFQLAAVVMIVLSVAFFWLGLR